METSLSNAIILLGIGMFTVLSILSLVLLTGHILILFVNKTTSDTKPTNKSLDDKTLSIIEQLVKKVSNGSAEIDKIETL